MKLTQIFGLLLCAVGIASAQTPPSITTQPTSLVVTQGSPAAFNVVAAGDAPLAYQWRKNGADILDQTNDTFSIASAASGDAAGYTVVITNSSGSITSDVATLTVLVPVAITGQPQSLTRTNGGTATFSVTATGTSPSYQWRKNGGNISGANSSSYTIPVVGTVDAAGYDVVVANTVNSQTSSVATLTVLVPPSITTQPTNTSACPGSTATFVAAASGDAPIGYQWYKNGSVLSGSTSATLALSALTSANAGNYSVVASNSSGTATSQVASLIVWTNVTLSGPANVANACVGSPVAFAVTASGTGPFSYTWKKGATVLQGPSGVSTYTIASVTAGDAGTYSVEVSGFCSSATNSATLTVAAAPSITAQPQPQITPMGNGATFSVTASSAVTPITYQWQTNGVNVAAATNSSFSISNLDLSMNGAQVRVIVGNCSGTTTSTAANLAVTPVSGISFDFDTPGQYTNAPYYLTYNNWVNGGFLAANNAPTVYEYPIGGVGPFPGSGSLDMANAQGTENTSVLIPISWDFSQTGKTIYASTMFKAKIALTAGRRATQFGLITSTNFGINDSNPQSFSTIILQDPATNTFELRTQRRSSGGGLQESVMTGTIPIVVSNWYRLNVTFINTKSASSPSNYTMIGSLQDMGPLGNTPGATNLSFTSTTNNSDIVLSKNVFLALRSFEDGGMDFRDNTYVWTTNGPIFFVQGPQSATVSQGNRAVFRSYVDGEGPYTYIWQRDNGAGGFTNIPLAGSWNYILLPARTSDNGAQFRVVVIGSANSITSAPATLTVTSQALAVVGAGSVDGTSVGIEFNQPVDLATAENPANYTINGVQPVAAHIYRTSLGALGPEGIYVLLAPAGGVISGSFNVAVSGVKDLSGNVISGGNTASGSVAGLIGLDVNPFVTAPAGEHYSFGPGKFIVKGGGPDIFSGADGFHFVYMPVTGDFDLKWKVPAMDTVRFTEKAGVDARFSLDPYSPSVLAAFDPGPMVEGSSTGFRQYSEGTSKNTWGAGGSSWGNNTRLFHPDVWMRFRRVGNNFMRYSSTNGVNWLFDGQTQPFQAYPNQDKDSMLVGLAVCAARNTFAASVQFESFGNFAGYSGSTIAISSQPTNFTVNAGSTFTDGLVATFTGTGVPTSAGELAYVWQRNDGSGNFTNLPTAGITNNTLAIGPLWGTDNGAQFRVVLKAPGALSVTSAVFTATVNDTTPPTISSVNPAGATYPASSVAITFSEFISDATATNVLNYLVTNASGAQLTVVKAEFLGLDRRTVFLTLGGLLGNGTSSVNVSGIRDLNNNLIAPVRSTFRSFLPGTAPVVVEYYQDIGAGALVDSVFTNHAMFTASQPSWISYSNLFGVNVAVNGSTFPGATYTGGAPANEDQYGVRAYTYFVPPTNGQYKFWIRGDDGLRLMMNTNGTDPLGKVLICQNTNAQANYGVGQSNTVTLETSRTNITLVGGQAYYMEMLMKEGGGNDGFSVMWTDPTSNAAPANTTFIPTANLSYPTSAAPVTPVIAEIYTGYQPASANNGGVLTLTTATNAPVGLTNYLLGNNALENVCNFKYIAGMPDFIGYEKYFGFQPQLGNTRVDNYLGRIISYFVPPTNGNYKFYLRSDDASQFYMNTNAANSTDAGGKVMLGRLDAYTSAYTLVASNVTLVGGQKYYMEALWREGTGGDGVAVAVRSQGDATVPPIGPPTEVIPSSMLAYPSEYCRGGSPINMDSIIPSIGKEGESLTLTVTGMRGATLGYSTGTEPTRNYYGYVWFKNGKRVYESGPNQSGWTNIIPPLTMADNGAVYTVIATNQFSSVTKSVTITVVPDTTAPQIVRTYGWRNGDGFSVEFNEPVDPVTATAIGNYQVSGGALNILSATLNPISRRTVAFTTSKQTPGTTYNITVSGIRDVSSAGNPMASTPVSFTSWTLGGTGFLVELYTNIVGSGVSDLVGSAKYAAGMPDVIYYTNQFGIGSFAADSGLNNYGGRISGYFVPTNTGYYRFYIRSDDSSMFSMNINATDSENPNNMTMLVLVNGANISFSDARAISTPVFLNQGQRYYSEALFKEGTGGDYLAVTFRQTDANGTALGNALVDAVSELQPFGPSWGIGAPGNPDLIQIASTPPANLYVTELETVNLALAANMPAYVRSAGSFQWQRWDSSASSFTNIPGATGTNISFISHLEDDGSIFRLLASFPGLSNAYTTTLHVSPDMIPPVITSVGSLSGFDLTVTFSKPVRIGSAGEPLNYDLNFNFGIPATSTGELMPDQKTVVFYLDSSAAGVPLVGGIDITGYGIESQAATPQSTTSSSQGKVENLVGANIGVPSGNVVGGYNPTPATSMFTVGGVKTSLALAVASNAVNVSASGYDIWNTADGFYYAYRQVSGNFDIKTRVQRLDGADQWSKAGIMARAGLTNISRYVMIGATPQASPIAQAAIDQFSFQARFVDGQASALNTQSGTNNLIVYPNAWVRLQRIGNTFNGYYSSNGVDWVLLDSRDTSTNGSTFPATLYLGLATASHDQTRSLANNAYAEYRDLTFPLGPTIDVQPSPASVTLPVLSSVTFGTVSASGEGDITYQWVKDGIIIPGATNTSLTLTNLAVTDSGIYNVIAQNTGGGTISSNCVLLVTNQVPVVVADNLSTSEGTPAVFSSATLLGNDSDPEGAPLSILAVSGVAPVTYSENFDVIPTSGAFFQSGTGGGRWIGNGGVNDSGNGRLTDGAASLSGSFVVNELTPRKRVQSFTASFMLRIADGSAEPADGFSFNFAPDVPLAVDGGAEIGVGTGFSFCVDNYRFLPYVGNGTPRGNGASTTANSSGMKLVYNGTNIAGVSIPAAWNTTRWVPVTVTVTADGVATVMVDGTNAFGNVALPAYTPKAGRFGFFARTGGQFASHSVDDVNITVLTLDTGRTPTVAGTLYGDTYIAGSGTPGTGFLHLTDNLNGQMGAFLPTDFTSGANVQSFNASFKLRIGNGTADGADGFSFNFANDLILGTSTGAEEGVGTGLSICVDNYPATGVSNAPAVKVKLGGIELGYTKIPKWNTNAWVPVNVSLASDGTVTVMLDGTNTITVASAFTPRAGRFGMYARTGGQNQTHWVDDLVITAVTTAGTRAYSESFSAGGPGTVTLAGGNVNYSPAENTCGTDTFYYLVSDGQLGGAVWDSATVTITPTNNNLPQIIATAPARSINVDSGCQYTLPDLTGQVIASGNCVSVTQNPPAGTLLGVGPTTVTFTVTDVQNNTATATTTVTGVDTVAPTITCPADIAAEATSASGAVVNFTPTAADNCTLASLVASPASGSTFPIGTNTVTVTATDAAGNSNVCSFLVVVRDTTAPAITCPATITATADDETGAVVTFTVTATDAVTANPPVISSPASGSLFPIGTNTVTSYAYDAAGNTNTCSFLVIVEQVTVAPLLSVSLDGTNSVVSWPASTPASFLLQQSGDLSSPTNWVNSSATITTVGTNKTAVIPATGSAKFFQLKKP